MKNVEVGTNVVPSTSSCGGSVRLLMRWRGSIYKLLWKPVLCYYSIYVSLTLLYDYALDESGKKDFESVALYCSMYHSNVGLLLVLGFFTSTAMNRWFATQTSVTGTGRAITVFNLSLKEIPEGEKIIETYSRWLLLSWALAYRMVCLPLKEQYPDLMSLETAGLLTSHERLELQKMESEVTWPLVVIDWLIQLLKHINRQNYFVNPSDYFKNVDLLLDFRKSCGNLIKFASKNIPFALIQAVAITIYAFGVTSLMSRQFKEKDRTSWLLSGYFPILHLINYFLCYVWFKFGLMAANPFGEDDVDIDIRNLFLSHIEDANRLRDLYAVKMGSPIDKCFHCSAVQT